MGKRSWSFIDLIEENKQAIVILLFLISITGGIVGYKYYRHTQDDPEFCMSCHLMQDAFKTWQSGKHRDFQCQICHTMTLIEQNKMMVSFVVRGSKTLKQKHGRISPWNACRGCHVSDVAQGSKTLTNSYGHARHVFMQNISCGKCHFGNLHQFSPNQQACSECHTDRLIHGLGMEGMQCLNCHNYSEKAPKMITSERCLRCHQELRQKNVMSAVNCFDCHHPHGKIKPSSQDCLKSCHGNESKVGQHNLHMTKAGLQCLDCHKAHRWAVGREQAVKICTRCHAYKDPAKFIY
jgi:nitrate/TMAO reductase-like tetraheme cytochrome c subunit